MGPSGLEIFRHLLNGRSGNDKVPRMSSGYCDVCDKRLAARCIPPGCRNTIRVNTRTKISDGEKTQHDQAGNLSKKRKESLTLGMRLGQNAPEPIDWDVLEATFHKQQSNADLN